MNRRDFAPGDDHQYIEGVPYAEVLAQWDPESIDSPERYWPYTRGLGASQGVILAPQESERSDVARSPLGASPARVPDSHLAPDSTTDPEGD